MTKKEVEKRIIDKATEMGLKAGYNELFGGLFISLNTETKYADFLIGDRLDSEKTDWANGIYKGELEISANICRMGGDTSPEELFMAADQIRLAAEFAKACEELDLSYTETFE